MKKNKIIIYLLITIVSLLSLSSEVKGEGNISQWSESSGNWCNWYGCAPDFKNEHDKDDINKPLQGYRITIFEKNGKDSKPIRAKKDNGKDVDSIDYVMYTGLSGKGSRVVHYTTNQYRSKVDYIFGEKKKEYQNKILKGEIAIENLINSNYAKNGYNLYKTGKRFPWVYGNASVADYKDSDLSLKSWLENGTKKNKTQFSNGNLIITEQNFKDIVQSGGFSMNNDFSKYYIVMEPLLLVTYKGEGYFGTPYELASAILPDNNEITDAGIINLSNVLRTNLPLAIFLDKNQGIDKENYFVTDENQKYYSFWTVTKDTTIHYTKQNIMGRYGYGLGLYWLGDFVENACQYTPQYFKDDDKNGKPDYTYKDSNGQTKTCCDYFNDGKHPNLVEDFPICAQCPETTKVTVIDKKTTDNTIVRTPGNSTLPTINDASDRCDVGKTPASGSSDKITSFTVENYLAQGINDNKCIPATSIDNNTPGNLIEQNINQYCTIKCIENDVFSIPDDPKVTVNTFHFVWPTNPNTSAKFGNYPLTASGTTTCRIVVRSASMIADNKANVTQLNKCADISKYITGSQQINKFSPNITLKHDNLEELDDQQLEAYNSRTICKIGDSTSINTASECNKVSTSLKNTLQGKSYNDALKALRNFRFSITKSMGFKLNSNLYTSQKKGQSTPISGNKITLEEKSKTTTIPYGNIPIYFFDNSSKYRTPFTFVENSSVKGAIYLEITNISEHFKNIKNLQCKVNYDASYSNPGQGSKDENFQNKGCYCNNEKGETIYLCNKNSPDYCALTDQNCINNKCSNSTTNHVCGPDTQNPGKAITINMWQDAERLNPSDPQKYMDESTYCNNFTCTNPGHEDVVINNSSWFTKLKELANDINATQTYFNTNLKACTDTGGGYKCSVWTDCPNCAISNSDWDSYYNGEGNRNSDTTQKHFDSIYPCNGSTGGNHECSSWTENHGTSISNDEWSEKLKQYGNTKDTQAYFDYSDRCGSFKCTYVNNKINSKSWYKKFREEYSKNVSREDATKATQTYFDNNDEFCQSTIKKKALVYRPIDLNDPFPSITGTLDNNILGRLPGSNWRTGDDTKINTQTIVSKYITNNRDVTTTDVYKKTPLYTFELNASTIAKIKEYNKTYSYDDYNNINCNKKNNLNIACISDFVHNTRYGFIDNTGRSSCAGITPSNFYKCSE